MQQAVRNKENKELKKIDLPDAIFKAPVRKQLLFDVVQMYLGNRRQGDAKAKWRWEVAGSTRKIYKQKGTGQARHGGIRANIFVGGGVAHPPRTRDWTHSVPSEAKKQALISALSMKAAEKKMVVVEDIDCKGIKTKPMVAQLKKWEVEKGLIVVDTYNDTLNRSVRNIRNVACVTASSLNAMDLMQTDWAVFTEKAVGKLLERLQ